MIAEVTAIALNVGISVKKVSKMAELKIKPCPFCGSKVTLNIDMR